MSVARKARQVLFLLVLLGTLFPSDALAYLDPGTGSLIVQSVIATLAVVAYGVRLYWGRIQLLFKRTVDHGHSTPDQVRESHRADTGDSGH